MTRPKPPANPWGLSAAQCAVIAQVTETGCDKLAARNLNLTIRTIECHMNSIKKKAGAKNRVQAVVKWDRHFRPNGDSSGAPTSPAN